MGIVLTGVALLSLTACKHQDQKHASSKVVSAVRRSKTSTSKKKTTAKPKEVTVQSSSRIKKGVKKVQSMNFDQIQQGDYSSLQGTWTETMHSVNKSDQIVKGGTDTLTVSNGSLTNGTTKIHNQVLTDTAGDHDIVFNAKADVLVANLADENVAINWKVKFYPKGTTNQYRTDGETTKNSQNLIVIWTSNNSYTEVFAQTSNKVPDEKPKTVETGLNLSQISKNNFSSMAGTWKNNHDGKTIVVTNKIMKAPAGSNVAWSTGAVLSGAEHNGYPDVITAGKITNGYIQGGIGTFHAKILGASFDPLAIIPKNVKLSNSDDSDYTRDRLILGGGQGGTGTQAYYRQ